MEKMMEDKAIEAAKQKGAEVLSDSYLANGVMTATELLMRGSFHTFVDEVIKAYESAKGDGWASQLRKANYVRRKEWCNQHPRKARLDMGKYIKEADQYEAMTAWSVGYEPKIICYDVYTHDFMGMAKHNIPCPVCFDESALLERNVTPGQFDQKAQPCVKCQNKGWRIRKGITSKIIAFFKPQPKSEA